MTEPRSFTQQDDTTDPANLARAIADLAADKKAIDIAELDLRGVLGYTDFFVICSGNTDRQTKAIHDGIHYGLKKDHGLLPRRVAPGRRPRVTRAYAPVSPAGSASGTGRRGASPQSCSSR